MQYSLEDRLIRIRTWLRRWKPIHLCWLWDYWGEPVPRYFIGGGDAAPQLEGSRIANGTRTWQADEDLDVTDWTIGDPFIVSIGWGAQSGKKCNAREMRIRWRNVTDSGTFADLGSSGELTYSATTDLVNDNGLTEAESGLAASQTTYVAGVEREGANAFTFTNLDADQWTACAWAIDTTNALGSKQYEFELYNVTDAVSTGTVAAQLTTAAAGATEYDLALVDAVDTVDTGPVTSREVDFAGLVDAADTVEAVTIAQPAADLLDDFDRANETPLSGGGNWTQLTINTQDVNLVSNQAQAGGSDGGAIWAGDSFGANQYVYATMQGSGNDFRRFGLLLRVTDSASGDFYLFEIGDVSTEYKIWKNVSGSWTQLGTTLTGQTPAAGNIYRFEVEDVGSNTTLRLYENGTLKMTRTDSAGAHTSGSIGIYTYGNFSVKWDDFSGGDLIPPYPVALVDAVDATEAATIALGAAAYELALTDSVNAVDQLTDLQYVYPVWIAEVVASSSSWTNYNGTVCNLREILAASDLDTDGDVVILTFRGHSSTAEDIDGCAIGPKKASSDPYDFDAAPTRVTFNGGNNTGTIPAGGFLTSDPITYDLDSSIDHLVTIYNGGIEAYLNYTGGGYRKLGSGDESQTQDVTGYSTQNYIEMLSLVQIVPAAGAATYALDLTDAIDTAETISLDLVRVIALDLTDAVDATEAATSAGEKFLVTSEAVDTADTATDIEITLGVVEYDLALADAADTVDTGPVISREITAPLADAIDSADLITALDLLQQYLLTLAEAVDTVEAYDASRLIDSSGLAEAVDTADSVTEIEVGLAPIPLNATDAVDMADQVTGLDVVRTFALDLAEAVDTSEAATLAVIRRYALDLAEAADLSESATADLVRVMELALAEAIDTADSIDARIGAVQYAVALLETLDSIDTLDVTVTEYPEEFALDLLEAADVTEAVSIEVGAAPITLDLADSVDLLDQITDTAREITSVLAEAVDLADTYGATRELASILAEAVDLAEAPAWTRELVYTITDLVDATDLAGIEYFESPEEIAVALAEALATADSIATAVQIFIETILDSRRTGVQASDTETGAQAKGSRAGSRDPLNRDTGVKT